MSDDPWAEFTPVKKTDDPWAEFTPVAEDGTLATIGKALRYGVSQAFSGPSATLKEQGQDGTYGKLATGTLDSAANIVAPQDYAPAGDRVANKNLSLWERLKAYPRSVLEAAPGMAVDLGAGYIGGEAGAAAGAFGGPLAPATVPLGAALGGALGFGGSYLLRNFGNDAKGSAVSRTGDPNATPNSEDEKRALEAGIAGAALSRIGVKGTTGTLAKAAGGSTLGQVAAQAGKAAVVDAGTSGVSDYIHQDLIDRTQQTPSDAAIAAVGGAGTGVAVRGALGTRDVATASRFKDIEKGNPESAARVANALEDTSDKSKSFDSINKLGTQLRSDLDEASKDSYIGPQIKARGINDDTPFLLNQAKDQLRQGLAVGQDNLSELKNRLGTSAEGQKLVTTMEDLNTVNQLKATGDYDTARGTFDGGLRTTPIVKNVISPFSKIGQKLDAGGLIAAGLSHLGYAGGGHRFGVDMTGLGLGLTGGLLGTYGAAKGIDKLTGADNLASGFKTRFSDPNLDPQPQLPSFRQGLVDDKAANDTANEKLRQLGRTAAIMQRSQQGPTSDAVMPLRVARMKEAFAQQAERARADEVKQQVSTDRAKQREETLAALKSLQEGQGAEDRFQARVAELGAARKQAEPPIQLQPGERVLTVPGQPQAQSAPKAPLDPHKYITLTDGGEHTVQRTTEGVMKPDRYQAGGNTRMQTRTQAVDAMKAEAPSHAAQLNSMLRDLNRNATTRAEGKRLVEEHLNDMPADVQATVRKHIKDEFWQTWKKIGK